MEWGFCRLSVLPAANHQYRSTEWNTKAATLTSSLASSLVHPQLDSWWAACCSTPFPTSSLPLYFSLLFSYLLFFLSCSLSINFSIHSNFSCSAISFVHSFSPCTSLLTVVTLLSPFHHSLHTPLSTPTDNPRSDHSQFISSHQHICLLSERTVLCSPPSAGTYLLTGGTEDYVDLGSNKSVWRVCIGLLCSNQLT